MKDNAQHFNATPRISNTILITFSHRRGEKVLLGLLFKAAFKAWASREAHWFTSKDAEGSCFTPLSQEGTTVFLEDKNTYKLHVSQNLETKALGSPLHSLVNLSENILSATELFHPWNADRKGACSAHWIACQMPTMLVLGQKLKPGAGNSIWDSHPISQEPNYLAHYCHFPGLALVKSWSP